MAAQESDPFSQSEESKERQASLHVRRKQTIENGKSRKFSELTFLADTGNENIFQVSSLAKSDPISDCPNLTESLENVNQARSQYSSLLNTLAAKRRSSLESPGYPILNQKQSWRYESESDKGQPDLERTNSLQSKFSYLSELSAHRTPLMSQITTETAPLTQADWLLILTGKNKPCDFPSIRIYNSLFCTESIPDNMRGDVWCQLLRIDNLKAAQDGRLYQKLVSMTNT